MDDPIFDPWGDDAEKAVASPTPQPPAAVPGQRWRSPAPGKAALPLRAGLATPLSTPRERLAGTAGFLRSMAAPRLAEIAGRLQLARHESSVEDLLDGTPPTLRLLFRPWRGPWTEQLAAPLGVLELVLADDSEERVALRTWLDVESPQPTQEVLVSPARLGAEGLQRAALDFVRARLARV